MGAFEIIVISIGLAMDAFAVSICKGLSMSRIKLKNVLTIGAYFGIFQAVMPIIGYYLGRTFSVFVEAIDHWIVFILLLIIGTNMIVDALKNDETEDYKTDMKTMIVLALATSIDALAVGITFAFFETNIIFSAVIIGIITSALSVIGVNIGNKFGDKFDEKAKILGGIILILIGIKILLEHLGILVTLI